MAASGLTPNTANKAVVAEHYDLTVLADGLSAILTFQSASGNARDWISTTEARSIRRHRVAVLHKGTLITIL